MICHRCEYSRLCLSCRGRAEVDRRSSTNAVCLRIEVDRSRFRSLDEYLRRSARRLITFGRSLSSSTRIPVNSQRFEYRSLVDECALSSIRVSEHSLVVKSPYLFFGSSANRARTRTTSSTSSGCVPTASLKPIAMTSEVRAFPEANG